MGIGIFLRDSNTVSHFQNVLTEMIASLPGEELLLCSGYFNPKIIRGKYGLTPLGKALSASTVQVSLLGALFGGNPANFASFKDFALEVRALGRLKLCSTVVGDNWHAKVAIKIYRGKPIAIFIGSSNLTQPAYNAGSWMNYWNRECDVLIFLDKYDQVGALRVILNGARSSLGILSAIPDPEIDQPDLESRLQKIYDDVASTSTEPFNIDDDSPEEGRE